jgi:hypothetical protein
VSRRALRPVATAAERTNHSYRPPSPAEIDPQLPQDLDAERGVLGAILIDNRLLNTATEKQLEPGDFFSDHNRTIFALMIAMARAGQPITLVGLTDQFRRKRAIDSPADVVYRASLVDQAIPRAANVEQYARIIKEKASLRAQVYAADLWKRSALEAEEDASVLLDRMNVIIASMSVNASSSGALFDTAEEFENTPEPTFSIKEFLQDYGVNAIAGLSGTSKTWVSMNIASAMLFGPGSLWGHFEVTDRAEKVIYLIPEASRATFKKRLKLMNLYEEIGKRLFVRTLSKGPVLQLTDREFLRTAKGAHVICDTAIRFMKAVDENSASEAAQGLSDDFFALQRAEVKSIIALFHSPKSFASQRVMTLEGMIRGTSEFGAVLATAWGLRQIDHDTNTVHVENLKDRDFQSCGPFQLIGRPFIDQEGGFRIHRRPGECGKLAEYLEDVHNRSGGAPDAAKESKAANLALLRTWRKEDPDLTSTELVEKYKAEGIEVKDSTIRHYKRQLETKT